MVCQHCGEDIITRGNAYERHVAVCSKMPDTDTIMMMIKRGRGYENIGREYGVSGKAVRWRVFMADPFAQAPKSVPKEFSKDNCRICDVLLDSDLARPAENGLCAMCI